MMGDLAVIGAQADPRCQLQLGEASSDASDAMSAHTLPNDDRYDAQRFWIEVGSTHQITIGLMRLPQQRISHRDYVGRKGALPPFEHLLVGDCTRVVDVHDLEHRHDVCARTHHTVSLCRTAH